MSIAAISITAISITARPARARRPEDELRDPVQGRTGPARAPDVGPRLRGYARVHAGGDLWFSESNEPGRLALGRGADRARQYFPLVAPARAGRHRGAWRITPLHGLEQTDPY